MGSETKAIARGAAAAGLPCVGLCSWRVALCSWRVALCSWRVALCSWRVALCSWRVALRSRRLSVLVRCALYSLALLVLFAPRTARADGPMCDRVGASVNVVPEAPPARSGRVEELPCDTDKLLLLLDQVRQPRRAFFHEWDQQQVPAWLLLSTFSWRAPVEGFAQAYPPERRPLQGHPRPVYRPPLAV